MAHKWKPFMTSYIVESLHNGIRAVYDGHVVVEDSELNHSDYLRKLLPIFLSISFRI